MILTDFSTASQLVDYHDEATEIVIRTSSLKGLEDNATVLRESFATPRGLTLIPWTELSESFNQASKMFAFTALVVSGIIYAVVLVTLANTVLTSVFERSREIGMLTAMGAPGGVVTRLFLTESLILSVAGIIIGLVLHGLITAYTATHGITVPPPPGAIDPIVLHPSFSWGAAAQMSMVMISITLVASLYPARFAARLDPVEAIHGR